jgi:outer membrane protein
MGRMLVLQRNVVFATMCALLAAAVARPSVADEIKLGYVDGEKIVQSYKGYKDAESQFEKQRDAWNQEFDKRSRELKASEEDFKAQQLMLSEAKRKEKIDLLETRRKDLEKYYQDIFGPNGEAARKNEELLRPILDKVNLLIKEYGQAEKYTLILDAANTGIAYAPEAINLTDKIIERLNAQ